jgi:Zn-dependent protease
MNWSMPLGRAFGTEIRAHWSWVLILSFIAVVLGTDLSVQASSPDGWNEVWAWGTATVTAVLVFVSVMVHELAHVAVARRNGMRSPAVVIQLIGGVFTLDLHPKSPGEEFRVSFAGSALSFLLMGILGAVTLLLSFGPMNIDTAPLALQALQFVAFVLALFNGFLGGVNLVPGYPLDGARIAHAVLWRRTGSEAAAAAGTVRIGRFVGLGLIVTGVFIVFFGDATAGLCLSLGGWMIAGASRALDRRAQLRGFVAGLLVSDAIDTDVATIPPQLTLDVFAAEYLGPRTGTAALVERGDEVIGLVGTAQIRRASKRTWNTTHTAQIMIPIASVPSVAPDSDLWGALEVLERSGLDAMLVAGGAADQRPALMTRRAAALKVREKAEERGRELLATRQTKKGPFGGR